MLKRANSYIKLTEILQFMLLSSDLVGRGRLPFFAINSHQFEKDWIFEEDFTVPGQEKDIRIRTIKAPGRKTFRVHLAQLLEEKLITRIITKDKRSKYYSITPLGIIHLLKSEFDYESGRYPFPDQMKAIFILQTFAQQNVKLYKSIIFEKEKFFNSNMNVWDEIGKWSYYVRRAQIPHVFTNVVFNQEKNKVGKYYWNILEYYVTNGYSSDNKISLISADLISNEFVTVTELDGFERNSEESLKLNLEQFHHFLANLMLCSLIYDYSISEFDMINIRKERGLLKKWKKTKNQAIQEYFEELSEWPEYYLRIIFLFSRHVERLTKNQYELTSTFHNKLNQIQFN